MGLQKLLICLLLQIVYSDFAFSQGCSPQEDRSLRQHCVNPYVSNETLVCSRRGECVCGACECHPIHSNTAKRYSGRYCECNDYSCSFHKNQICGGHGVCDCGQCMCDPGFIGLACECPMSTETCLSTDGQVCNGQGNCSCGVCKCSSESSYKGPTCEECPTCPGQCTGSRDCVLCKAFRKGRYSPEECDSYCGYVQVVDDLDMDKVNVCQFVDDDSDCRYTFGYWYGVGNKVEVTVKKNLECPPGSSASQHRYRLSIVTVGTVFATLLLFTRR